MKNFNFRKKLVNFNNFEIVYKNTFFIPISIMTAFTKIGKFPYRQTIPKIQNVLR